jgi:hypothetical protein
MRSCLGGLFLFRGSYRSIQAGIFLMQGPLLTTHHSLVKRRMELLQRIS